MSRFVIEGGRALSGEVTVSGAKNAALPIIAATALLDGPVTLHQVPDIADIKLLVSILEGLGAKVNFSGQTLTIDSSRLNSTVPDPKKVRNLRGSILLLGPMIAKYHEVELAYPGGCFIGHRPIDVHLHAIRSLGAKITEEDELFRLKTDGLRGARIVLREMSVTATENAILAAVLAEGITEIHLAAAEPHVQDLVRFLNATGAKITGGAGNVLRIEGVKSLHGVEHTIIPDSIEAGTYLTGAIATNSEIEILNVNPEDLDVVLMLLEGAGARVKRGKDSLSVKRSVKLKATNITAMPYPNFPTDLQAPWAVMMTQASGTSLIHDPMFEGRMNYIRELIKMGADARVLDSHRAMVIGPTPLFGSEITSLDLRAGATLIIASLLAEGTSTIFKAEIIDRGYEKIDDKLRGLGAKIERHD